MNALPPKARWFLIFVYSVTAGTLAAIWNWHIFQKSHAHGSLLELAILAAASIAAGGLKVKLLKRPKNLEMEGSMSLGFVVIFAAMLRLGPAGAVLIGALTTLRSCLWPKRHAPHQLFFNLSTNFLQTFLSCEIFAALNGGFELGWVKTPLAVLFASLSFFFINTGAVATIIGLVTSRNILKIWCDSFLFTAPSYFIGAGVATAIVSVLGDHVVYATMCIAPVAGLTYFSYKGYADRAEALLRSKEELAELYLQTVRSLALAIDAKDQYTHQHIVRVQQYAVATARQMGLSDDEVTAIEMSALLHDIGKLGVPEYVLLKPGRLTEDEFAKVREHPRIGADILDPVRFPWPVLPGVKHHHERWDGSGYPDGLVAEEIPLQGRILAVADVYDALTSDRSYRNAWPHEKAKAEIERTAGSHFDARVVSAFLEVIDDVVAEMAKQGAGPLHLAATNPPAPAGILGTDSRLDASAAAGRRSVTRADVAVRDIQRASAELWALYEVSQTLSASVGLHDTLEILTRKLEIILPGATCVFLICDEGGQRDGAAGKEPALQVHASAGPNAGLLANCRAADGSLSASVLASGESFLGAFDPQDIEVTSSGDTPWTPLRSAMIVPMTHQGTSIGTINVYHSQEWAFGPQDLQFLERIAERAALAIWNGLLFDRTLTDALTDPLTGLANIRRMTSALEEFCARPGRRQINAATVEERHRFALLCLDLDAFKPINDNFGHVKGDEVLRNLARIFRQTVAKEEDVVARYGGDEFLIVLEGADAAAASRISARLEQAVATYDPGLFHARLGPLHLSVSIGAACFPDDGTDVTTLLSVADARMYRAKAERKLGRLAGDEAAVAVASRGGSGVLAYAAGNMSLPASFAISAASGQLPAQKEDSNDLYRDEEMPLRAPVTASAGSE